MSQLINKLKAYCSKNMMFLSSSLLIIGALCIISFAAGEHNKPVKQHNAGQENGFVTVNVDEPEKVIPAVKHYRSIPVLIYHYVKDSNSKNDLNMPKEKFRQQMKYLKDNNYSTLSLDELYSHFTDGTTVPEKPVVITFDDGDRDLFENAYPVLKEYNIKATIFMITSFIDKHPGYLTSAQLIELQKNGIDIESHTGLHEKLDDISYEHQISTLKSSKEALDKLLNKEVKYIAYPYGAYNAETIKACKESGYKMAFTGIRGLADKTNGIYELHRIYIGKMDGMALYKKVLNGDFSNK